MQKSIDVRRLWERALIVALLGSAVTGSACIGGGADERTVDALGGKKTLRFKNEVDESFF